ncbi:probable long-chain-alcohol O-fatty-acyltransferase 5 [Cucurbita pepo subsp. pepo]|uniref:probable long-chain-alcohol O-fatty-acyltransferase 5 n=1 Tax=Cucurbita pepo subsp. pepo TaxID=3664 RepID=UPI000C9D88D2|nr:probable long-chain-alcohol O-fatty-acyltransferase 5 [Cucurbita pepo subsp. pepo]
MAADLYTLLKISAAVLASLLYSYFISTKLPKGLPRLLSLLPILSLYTLLPLPLSSLLLAGIVAFFITWLASFKLLLFCFDSGPLFTDPPLSFPLFVSIACFPIRIKQNQPDPDPQNPQKPTDPPLKTIDSPKLPLNLPAKGFLFAVLVAGDDFAQNLSPNAMLCFYCVSLYLFIDVVLGLSNTFVRWGFGIELEPPSNEPYLATSLRDFWGRRWNLLVSNTLRWSVFLPVRAAVSGVLGRRRAAVVAVFATFVVSGLMHELLFYYVTGAVPTWEVTGFFVLHGVCVVLEFWVKKALGENWRLHWAVAGPLTLAFVVITAAWLFFPPLLKTGAVAAVIGECKAAAGYVK